MKNPKHYFSRALIKHGKDSFSWEVLFESNNEKELFKKEIELIKEYQSNNSIIGYNMTKGGDGVSTGTYGKNIIRVVNAKYNEILDLIAWAQKTKIENRIGLKRYYLNVDISKVIENGIESLLKIKQGMEKCMKIVDDEEGKYFIEGYFHDITKA
jgi:hypothetical protein